MNESNENRSISALGWIVSLVLHGGLAIVFLFIVVEMTPVTPRFIEVAISQVMSVESANISPTPTSSRPPIPAQAAAADESQWK